MKVYLNLLIYLFQHKYYVFLECCKLGIPWLGIIHDLSKFNPVEFVRYARWGFGENKDKQQWTIAWHHHMHHNKHHPEYYLLTWRGDPCFYEGIGEKVGVDFIVVLPMPVRYCLEFVADLRGKSHESNNSEARLFYMSQRDKMILHSNTRAKVESLLGVGSDDH
jgi:hypothetical protein